jgi:hypothetical protein
VHLLVISKHLHVLYKRKKFLGFEKTLGFKTFNGVHKGMFLRKSDIFVSFYMS